MMGKRHRYTSEFKAEAVRLAARSGQPVAQIARELGVNEQTLHKWKRQVRRTPDSFGATGSDGVEPDHFAQQEENRRLRRELTRVTEERDILKKATAFFANESR